MQHKKNFVRSFSEKKRKFVLLTLIEKKLQTTRHFTKLIFFLIKSFLDQIKVSLTPFQNSEFRSQRKFAK